MIHGGEQVDLTQNLSEKELLQNTGRDYVFEHFMIKRYQNWFNFHSHCTQRGSFMWVILLTVFDIRSVSIEYC